MTVFIQFRGEIVALYATEYFYEHLLVMGLVFWFPKHIVSKLGVYYW
jgi:hypothetical protein